MPFIVDDLAVAAVTAEAATAATETAGAVEAATGATTVETAISTTAAEATTTAELSEAAESTRTISASDVVSESSTLADLPTIEGDLTCPGTVSNVDMLDSALVDEFPVYETSDLPSGTEGFNENVFYDEFPSKNSLDQNPVTETISESSQEINDPKSYEELCETRECGGSYKELKNEGWGWNDNPPHEVHHMPADSASHLEREEGPAIAIDYSDHQQTASCGSSREAKEYRAEQKELIDSGDFRGALQMDIDDLHDKYGDKYDEAISQMLDYVDKLEQAGKI